MVLRFLVNAQGTHIYQKNNQCFNGTFLGRPAVSHLQCGNLLNDH